MKTPSTIKGRALAIFAGAAFAAGGLNILLGPSLLQPATWDSYQWLTILTVFGTIAAGHLMVDAKQAGHLFAMLGFLVLFLSGTGLVVYQSVGRQVETITVSAISAEDVNARLVAKHDELRDAKVRLAYAESQFEAEQTGQRCRERCRRWEQTAKDRRIVVASLEKEIAAIGPQKPVNAQADAMADIALLFGIHATKGQVVAALLLLVPFCKTLFFEIGAIVSLGFAFRHGKVSETVSDLPSISDQFPPEIEPPKGRKSKPKANVVQFPAKHPVLKALSDSGGTVSSNRELASLMSVSEGEASKRYREVADQLRIERVGKQLKISLA